LADRGVLVSSQKLKTSGEIAMQRVYWIPTLLLALALGAIGQNPPKAELIDEIGIDCSEMVMASYDGFLSRVHQNPAAKGLILLNGDETTEGRNIAYFNYLSKWYPQVRQVKDLRLEFIRGSNQKKTRVTFWLVPAGAENPLIEPFRRAQIDKTSRYDVATGDLRKSGSRSFLYDAGFYELGCSFGPNLVGFVDELKRNNTLDGYLVVYTTFGKGRTHGNKVAKFAVADLMKKFKISRARIKTLYGGNREDGQVEFWLVRKGDRLPALSPDEKAVKK
jgi:hypothetical protein